MSSSSFKDRRVLIVGGAGFVGSNLTRMILQDGPQEILVIDNLLSADVRNIADDSRVTFVNRSITDEAALAAIPNDLHFAFHLACFHGNQSSIHDPMADHENNTLTSLKLFDRLKSAASLEKVVYAAAGCAVAEKTYEDATATAEDAPVNMFQDSPYSISKLVGEFYGNYYFTRHDLPFVKARFQNVYGPGEILGAGQWRGTPHSVWRNVIPSFIFRSINGEALPLDNGGMVSRDFIFVEDIARGLIACALNGRPGDAYNLATGQETMIKDLAAKINELTRNNTPVDLKPARDWDSSGRRFGDTQKASAEIGFETSISIDEGLERTVSWTQDNMETILSCIGKHQVFLPEVKNYLSR